MHLLIPGDPYHLNLDALLELGRALFEHTPTSPAPIYLSLIAAGEPVVHVSVPGLMEGDCILLSTNLDGSRWVLPWHGSELLIQARYCTTRNTPGARTSDIETAVAAWERQNVHGLSDNQVKVLTALRDAGDWGMIDHGHEAVNGLKQDTAGKRRLELMSKGLVAEKTHFTRQSPRGSRAQVWIITTAGQQALRSDRPPSIAHRHARAHPPVAS